MISDIIQMTEFFEPFFLRLHKVDCLIRIQYIIFTTYLCVWSCNILELERLLELAFASRWDQFPTDRCIQQAAHMQPFDI